MTPFHQLLNTKLNAATEEKTQSGIGWDSHKAIDEIPDSLVRTLDGKDSMRRKFEELCRTAQVFVFIIAVIFFYSYVDLPTKGKYLQSN
jgi:hypothetical protein